MAEYVHNYPGMPEGAKAVMHHLKLDLVACCNFSWREAHHVDASTLPIALDCLRKTLPPTDEDQRLTVLHAPFKGTTLFGGELAKLQEGNMNRAATFAVFPMTAAPPVSYSYRPYVGRGKRFSDRKGPKKPSGRLADSPSRPTSLVTTSGTDFRNAEPGRFCSKRKEIRAAKYPVSRNSPTFGLRGSLLPESKAQEIATHACKLSSLRALSYHQVSQLMGSLNWASGFIPLGRLYLRPLQCYFDSFGLTDQFTPPSRSDPLVLASLLQQWQDLSFLTSRIPICPFQAKFTIFMDASTQGCGAPTWGIPKFQVNGPLWTASSISIAWNSRQ